jgi:hypothetical protein
MKNKMKLNKIIKFLGYTTFGAGIALISMEPVMAQGLNNVTKTLISQFPGVAKVISGASYIMGVGLGVKAALKFKEHHDSQGQVKLGLPITYAVVAAILLSLPSYLSTSKQTVFGSGAKGTTIDGGNITTIN